jgi:hypothetical protein
MKSSFSDRILLQGNLRRPNLHPLQEPSGLTESVELGMDTRYYIMNTYYVCDRHSYII